MGIHIRKKGGKLYLDIYQNGKRVWEALHLTLTSDKEHNKNVMRLAEICKSKREMQMVAGEWGIQDLTAGRISIYEYAVKIADMPNRSASIKPCAAKIKDYHSGNIQLSAISPEWVKGFQNYLQNDCKLALSTASGYFTALKTILNQAVKDNILQKSPASIIANIKAPEKAIMFLTLDELTRLYAVANEPEWCDCARAFLFGYYTGLRFSDLQTLTWGMINLNPLQLAKIQKKTEAPVYVPLKEEAWALINDGKEHGQNGCVFYLPSYKKTMKPLDNWANAAGVNRNLRWHLARKTFATQSLQAGAEIYTVSKLLGHTDLRQIKKYAEATDKLKRAAVDKLPVLN